MHALSFCSARRAGGVGGGGCVLARGSSVEVTTMNQSPPARDACARVGIAAFFVKFGAPPREI